MDIDLPQGPNGHRLKAMVQWLLTFRSGAMDIAPTAVAQWTLTYRNPAMDIHLPQWRNGHPRIPQTPWTSPFAASSNLHQNLSSCRGNTSYLFLELKTKLFLPFWFGLSLNQKFLSVIFRSHSFFPAETHVRIKCSLRTDQGAHLVACRQMR